MTPRPAIVQVLHSLEIGGAERLAFSLVRRLSEEFRFCFFCLDRGGAMLQQVRDAGYEATVAERSGSFDLSLARQLRSFSKQQSADLLHAHQYTPFFYSMLSRLGGRTPPILFTEHGRFHPDSRDGRRVALNRLLLRRDDRLVAVGESVRQALVDFEGMTRDRIEVLYNGVGLEPFLERSPERRAAARQELREELSIDQQTKIAIVVARLDPIKDHATAIAAITRARNARPDLHLVLVGDGPSRGALEQLSEDKPFVHLLGEREDIANLLHASDLQLLTSVSEGIPLCLIEGMAAGLPVAATSVGGIPEVIAHERQGILVGVSDVEALARAIERMTDDSALAEQLGTAGRERSMQEFSLETMAERYAETYRQMLARR